LQSDLGLGRLSYLIWVDQFNVVSLVMLSCALLESIGVHYLLRRNKEVEALFLDKVFRVILPLGVYACLVVGQLVYGLTESPLAGMLISILGSLACIVLGLVYVRVVVKMTMKARRRAIAALSAAVSSGGCFSYSKEVEAMCQRVFELFDFDHSGKISVDELKEIMKGVYPEELAPGKESPITLIQKSRRALDLGEDELELPGFVQVVIFASRIMMKRSESGLSLDELDELDEFTIAKSPTRRNLPITGANMPQKTSLPNGVSPVVVRDDGENKVLEATQVARLLSSIEVLTTSLQESQETNRRRRKSKPTKGTADESAPEHDVLPQSTAE